MMELYRRTHPKAKKPHTCEFCNKEIHIGEKYSYETGKYDGEMFTRKLCLVCEDMLESYCRDEGYGEFDQQDVDDWLQSVFCYSCDKREECTIPACTCTDIRSKFRSD